jgi:hypothetical protein
MNRNVFRVVLALSALAIVAGTATAIYFAATGRHHPAPTTGAPEPQVTINEDQGNPANDPPTTPEKGPEITGRWDSKVMRGKDPVSGAIQIGLSGRFVVAGAGGNEQEPLSGDLTVEVYDLKPSESSIEPRLLEEWLIESANLPAFGKQEKEGLVLNLNLPWSTYRPDIASVKLAIKFKPARGEDLTHESTVTLDHSAVQTAVPEGAK